MNPDAWDDLRQHTKARIALGRAGASIPTQELLDFRLAHARARDAVHSPFDAEELSERISKLGIACHLANTQARDKQEYLLRPDLGRRLDEPSCAALQKLHGVFDLSVIVSNGLSAAAVRQNAVKLISHIIPLAQSLNLRMAPLVIVRNGRVAVQDEIGQILGAKVALIALGERPGLGSAESLGLYFVYSPQLGRKDADRNCISNVRDGGLSPDLAASKVLHLIRQSLNLGISGVHLKDDGESIPAGQRSNLIP